MAYLIGNRNDGRANAGNEKHTPGPEAETVSHVPRSVRLAPAWPGGPNEVVNRHGFLTTAPLALPSLLAPSTDACRFIAAT